MVKSTNTLLSLQEVADLIGVHPETLRRWDREGKLPAIKINERGDRKYRYGDVIKVLGNFGTIEYKGFKIMYYSPGFEMFPDRFGSIAKIVVQNDQIVAGFAFAIAGLKLFANPEIKTKDLENTAVNKVKEFIDKGNIQNLQEYTFEFESEEFYEVADPNWWEKGNL